MKHLTAIFLLLLFAVLATMLPIRPGFRQLARRAMELRVEQASLRETVLIAASSITANAWEDEKEFRLDGKLYDVLGVSYLDGKKYYQCYVDELEVSAESKADDLVKDIVSPAPVSPQGKVARALADWLSNLYYAPAPSLRLKWGSMAGPVYPSALVAALSGPCLQRFAPPPEA